MSAGISEPRQEYAARVAARTASAEALDRVDARAATLRLLTFGLAVAIGVFAWREAISWWWLLLPVGIFIGLIRWHDGVIARRDAARRAIGFYERGLARLHDRWIGTGETGERFADPAHLYSGDLDLFGRGSLFELLSVARTRAGEETLARWLTNPAGPDEVRTRQAAVGELAPRLDLREELSLAGNAVGTAVHPATLVRWAEQPPQLPGGWLQPAAAVLTVLAIVTIVMWGTTGNVVPLVVVFALEALLFFSHRDRIMQVLHAAGGWSRDLDVLAQLLGRLHGETFTSPRLEGLRQRLAASGAPPATAIRRLHRLSEMHDWQHNMVFAAIGAPLLWDTHVALAMERWRTQHGPSVRAWLEVVGEFEALASLATYRYERPGDTWPEIVDPERSKAPLFEGTALGHPLLPQDRMIRNDVRLVDPTRLLVVSGSNMSGKSTLLRTVGINAVLAFAGAPVRASRLRLTPLALGATLRIQDSLQEGRSRFFAEITRLREIAERATDVGQGKGPAVLFLLDEIFHGTNSHDRVIGATGVLHSLIDRGAIGFVTTHDLALTKVAAELSPRALNVHFEDRFEAGEITFDYTMKDGPVTRSNALALMRAVGLDVDAG